MNAKRHRHLYLIILCLQILGSGCSDNGTPLDPGVALISGSWVWQRSQGGFDGRVILPPTGSRRIDTFTRIGEYTRVVNGILMLSARYTMKIEGEYLMVVYSNVQAAGGGYLDMHLFDQLVTVEGDTLHLADYGADMYRHTYARLR